jgi:uncharacterized protein YbbC (DUF1343 family)
MSAPALCVPSFPTLPELKLALFLQLVLDGIVIAVIACSTTDNFNVFGIPLLDAAILVHECRSSDQSGVIYLVFTLFFRNSSCAAAEPFPTDLPF